MMVIMSNKGATAKVIYEKLTEKFNLESITSVRSARLAEFHQLTLGFSEKETEFIDSDIDSTVERIIDILKTEVKVF